MQPELIRAEIRPNSDPLDIFCEFEIVFEFSDGSQTTTATNSLTLPHLSKLGFYARRPRGGLIEYIKGRPLQMPEIVEPEPAYIQNW